MTEPTPLSEYELDEVRRRDAAANPHPATWAIEDRRRLLATLDAARATVPAEQYLNLVTDWAAVMDYLGLDGDSTAPEVIAHLAARPVPAAGPHRPTTLDGVPTGWCECGLPFQQMPLAVPAADADRERLESMLLGMIRTSWPMNRDAYEKGWNEAIHAVRKKITALADLSPEDWTEVRGGDPIARTINATHDILDGAGVSPSTGDAAKEDERWG